MKFYRYIIFIGILVIGVPLLGIPLLWKQIILAVLGISLFVLVAFLQQASKAPSKKTEEESGSAFKDSDHANAVGAADFNNDSKEEDHDV